MARHKKNDSFDDLIELVSMYPWWVGVLLAPAFFLIGRVWAAHQNAAMLTHPTATSGIFYALALLIQFAAPTACLIGSVVSAAGRRKRKLLIGSVADAASVDALTGMSWHEFELLVGEGFRQKGYQVEELGGSGPDGGVDLVLRKDREKFLVQCKQWRAQRVGVIVVRELYGVMAATGAAGGFVVTSGRFTDEAQAFAKGRNVQLLDGKALLKLLHAARENPSTVPTQQSSSSVPQPTTSTPAPTCPRCAGPMVRREAKKGANAGSAFWGCGAFPKCRGTA